MRLKKKLELYQKLVIGVFINEDLLCSLLINNGFSISWHTRFLELLGYVYSESQTLNRVTKIKHVEKARQKFKESFKRYYEEERGE